ncbi:DUF262 domain-containing protein [Mycoplasmopsis equigenitalium]|uniref:DUF262 domain-containing protein n=1 Tax=Mycoplasmopsis equigenitalium TaxID=114883 RepID=A0ABY5J1Z9_9BACT|nr:DUF262 domain-containing protein [Mycoplasmopsis equigenitalium]UUD37020.1 DUF262 domain-containing protein [Mycoplasmopsis equigenitalium]
MSETIKEIKNKQINSSISVKDILTIINEMRRGDIYIPTYQRSYIYNNKKSSCLIESVLLGIPLPAIYLIFDENYKKEVIDGQQRLRSLERFLNNEFMLTGLEELITLNKKYYKDLDETTQRLLESYKLTICEFDHKSNEKKYDIFERINKGAIPLNGQEIRNCIYHGKFNDALKKWVKDNNNGLKELFSNRDNLRMKYEQTLLWIFSLNKTNHWDYKGSVQKHINGYMEKVYKLEDDIEIKKLLKTFKSTMDIFKEYIGYHVFCKNKRFSETLFDALFLPIFQYIYNESNGRQKIQNVMSLIKTAIYKIINDANFIQHTEGSSGNASKVYNRIEIFHHELMNCLVSASKREFNYSLQEKNELARKNNNICSVCGEEIISIEEAQIDHITPYTKGGKTNLENAQILHKYCNLKKSNK